MKFFTKRNKNKVKTDIAVAGIGSGSGVTNLTISLATFLGHAMSVDVGIVSREADYDRLIDGLCKLTSWGFKKKKIHFIRDGVPGNERPEYLLFDLGHDFDSRKEEFFRSDIRILVVNLSPWKVDAFKGHIARYGTNTHTIYLYAFGDEKLADHLSRRYGILLRPIPRETDPFRIDAANIKFYSNIVNMPG